MKKEINSNDEKLVNKVFEILTKFKENPKKFENIFTELFEKDFGVQLNEISQLENGLLKGLIISVKDLFDGFNQNCYDCKDPLALRICSLIN